MSYFVKEISACGKEAKFGPFDTYEEAVANKPKDLNENRYVIESEKGEQEFLTG